MLEITKDEFLGIISNSTSYSDNGNVTRSLHQNHFYSASFTDVRIIGELSSDSFTDIIFDALPENIYFHNSEFPDNFCLKKDYKKQMVFSIDKCKFFKDYTIDGSFKRVIINEVEATGKISLSGKIDHIILANINTADSINLIHCSTKDGMISADVIRSYRMTYEKVSVMSFTDIYNCKIEKDLFFAGSSFEKIVVRDTHVKNTLTSYMTEYKNVFELINSSFNDIDIHDSNYRDQYKTRARLQNLRLEKTTVANNFYLRASLKKGLEINDCNVRSLSMSEV